MLQKIASVVGNKYDNVMVESIATYLSDSPIGYALSESYFLGDVAVYAAIRFDNGNSWVLAMNHKEKWDIIVQPI